MAKKKTQESPPPESGLWMRYSESEHCIQDDFNRDDWSGYSEYQKEFHPISLHRSQPAEWYYEKLELNFDPKEVNKVWIVVARYTDGGTFGCTHGYWKVKAVCKTDDEAYAIKKQIENGTFPKPKYAWRGKDHEGMHEWEGYFAALDDVEVHRMEID
jgi:hypothetical protein